MHAGRLVALVAAAALAGCAVGQPANPNLAAPKLLVQARPDGNVTLFVHSAFGERAYEWLALRIDNGTTVNRTQSFSLEEQTGARGFYVEVAGGTIEQLYESRVRIDIVPDGERAMVAVLDAEGEWTEPRRYDMPYSVILERREAP